MTTADALAHIRDAPEVRYNAGEVCTDPRRLARSIAERLAYPRPAVQARADLKRACEALGIPTPPDTTDTPAADA